MIHDIHAQAGGMRRVLAVVSEREERAMEIAEQFAKQGEEVEALWYSDSRELLAEGGPPRFEAVILFPSGSEEETDSAESALRGALTNTPLYCVR